MLKSGTKQEAPVRVPIFTPAFFVSIVIQFKLKLRISPAIFYFRERKVAAKSMPIQVENIRKCVYLLKAFFLAA